MAESKQHNLCACLYDAIRELSYVQSVENCHSGLCATAAGKEIVERGMYLLTLSDLSPNEYPDSESVMRWKGLMV